VERQFGTTQDRLVKAMRVAGINTMDEANAYLDAEFLPWWNTTLAVTPANAGDAHRTLAGCGKSRSVGQFRLLAMFSWS
jgi:hypothetical protein